MMLIKPMQHELNRAPIPHPAHVLTESMLRNPDLLVFQIHTSLNMTMGMIVDLAKKLEKKNDKNRIICWCELQHCRSVIFVFI